MIQPRSAGLQTGVPNKRSCLLEWETGCPAGLLTRTACFAAERLP